MPAFALRADYAPDCPRHVCYLCGAAPRVAIDGARERVVDTATSIDWEGRLQVCETCVVEMGRLLGMWDTAQVDAARSVAAEAVAACDQLSAENDDLRSALAALGRAGGFPTTRPEVASEAAASLALVFPTEEPEAEPVPIACDECDWPSVKALEIHKGRTHGRAHKPALAEWDVAAALLAEQPGE